MKKIPANQLLAGLCMADATPITAVVTDSRRVERDCVFVCFPGEHVDGHQFAAQAVQQGAAYVVANHAVPGVPEEKLVLCESSHRAMVRMAANYRLLFTPQMVGVTGSVGKTTTKEFCYAVLSAFGNTLKTEGNQNNEIGLPNTLFRLEDDTQYAVVEMGMSELGEIERLSRAARPSAGIITCIGTAHMETLGSRENILRAKLEICSGLPDGAPLVLNADDPYLVQATLPSRLSPVWFGLESEQAQVHAEDICSTEDGETFILVDEQYGQFAVKIPTLGTHSIYDALAAYTAATRLGLNSAKAAKALSQYQTTGLRQHIVKKGGITVLEDCYNANPESMGASLEAFALLPCKGRRFALLGDMLELGDISEDAHAALGEQVALAGIDCLVAYGKQVKRTAITAAAKGLKVLYCDDPAQAAEVLISRLEPGDAVLAKGSRGMALEKILQMVYNGMESAE